MPKGPQGQTRPGDVIGNAVRVMRVPTGEETEERDPSNRRAGTRRAWEAVRAISGGQTANRLFRHAHRGRHRGIRHDLRRRGHVQKIGDGIGVRWKLAPSEQELI